MKTASITETKNRLSALLDFVRRGESVLILDRRRPIVRLEPVSQTTLEAEAGLLLSWERQGLIKRANKPLPEEFFSEPLPVSHLEGSLLEALLGERREGR
jgi:antitoxin (DNA-binding transcriptional repressor) of toxin-antitoxin stability system